MARRSFYLCGRLANPVAAVADAHGGAGSIAWCRRTASMAGLSSSWLDSLITYPLAPAFRALDRYFWIDNPHPDFDPRSVIGRRDDELIPAAEAQPIVDFKRDAWRERMPLGRTLRFRRSDGERAYAMMTYPFVNESGGFEALLTVGFDTESC